MDDDRETLRQEATAFIVRITSGAGTVDDAETLARWRAASPRHEEAFRDAARLWKQLGPALEDQAAPPHAPAFSRRAFLAGGSLAAGLAGIGLGLSELGYLPPLGGLLSDHATAAGEQRSVALPDGSTAWLDGGTALSLAYSDDARGVKLLSGAAVFDVVPGGGRPFVATAGEGAVVARRGSFAVKCGVEDVSVECIDGDVSVRSRGVAELARGEAISYSGKGLGQKSAADVEMAAAWRNGLLVFSDRSLEDVVADLNRHRRGRVMIARRELRRHRVSGVFHLDRPEEVLAHLEAALRVQPVDLPGGIVLLR